MIPLDKKDRSRQSSIWVDGEEYLIQTDFHYWISFGKKMEGAKEINLLELDCLYRIMTVDGRDYGIPENRLKGYEELCKFYRNDQPLPHPAGKQGARAFDWLIDSDYIYAAFLQQYGIDLEITDMHWHKFMALFYGLKDTKFNDIMSARLYEKPKKNDKRDGMEELKNAWELETLGAFKKEPFKMR